MTEQNRGILALIRSGLEGTPQTLPQGFDLSLAVPTLTVHGLLGLGYLGAKLCGYRMTDPAMQALTAAFVPELGRIRSQDRVLAGLYAFLEKENIDFMPIKGAVVRSLYPKPEMRSMSDADILIREEQYGSIRAFLTAQGCSEEAGVENEHNWRCGNILVELHNQLVPYSDERYGGYYKDNWRFAVKRDCSSRHDFRQEDHFVFQILHFAKHYRYGTVTAKNIVDFHIFSRAYPHMDQDYLCRELDRLELLGFYRTLQELLEVWFGQAEETEVTGEFTDAILRGSILSPQETEACWRLREDPDDTSGGKSGKLRWILQTLFPRGRLLEHRYPILKKCPWLLPFVWVSRLLGYAFALVTGRKRESASIRGLTVDAQTLKRYTDHLKKVGLN